MMAAYQPQPGAMPPGMAPHGHPVMTPGQPMNPAQMQMGHPGPVTPGAPHVTQPGTMMGMQPGVNAMAGAVGMGGQHPGGHMGGMPGQGVAGNNPNAHAMSHLNPQAAMQQQMLQQQQILQQNPHLAQQHQQEAMRRRLQMQQVLQNGGMPAMQQAAMQMNPQLQQQMQQNQLGVHSQAPVQLTQNILAQQQQLQALQARQQQQHQQAQNQQLIEHARMQQQQQQQSQQGAQSGQHNQQGGQPQQQGPAARPQSRNMTNANEQPQGGTAQNAQQNAQQAAQGQQQQQQSNQQQAQQGQANQQQGQQAGQQQAGQQQGQQQAITPQQMATLQMQRQQQIRAAQAQQQSMMLRQQQAQAQPGLGQGPQPPQGGLFLLKFMHFGEQLSHFDQQTGRDVTNWYNFVDRHFAPEARFIHSFPSDDVNKPVKQYEIPRATIPQYFRTYFDSNALGIRLHTELGREILGQANRHQVVFGNSTLTVTYPNGVRLEMAGTIKVLFAPNSDSIELMELQTASVEEHVARSEIEKTLNNWSPTMGNKASPKMAKNKVPKAQQKMQSQLEGLTIDHFPKTPPKGTLGITQRMQYFLEIGETMTIMADLVAFAQEKKLRPDQAVNEFNVAFAEQQQNTQQGNPQINLPPNGIPVGNRTPSMQNMQMPNAQGGNQFSSPSVANLNLPMQNGMGMNGSPNLANNPGLVPNMGMANSHTPSPHQANMAAPSMMPQHSQQGTNSSAASANTSPNNNKRRRSTVKLEGDEAAGEGGGKVKPSPRMPKRTKPGGN